MKTILWAHKIWPYSPLIHGHIVITSPPPTTHKSYSKIASITKWPADLVTALWINFHRPRSMFSLRLLDILICFRDFLTSASRVYYPLFFLSTHRSRSRRVHLYPLFLGPLRTHMLLRNVHFDICALFKAKDLVSCSWYAKCNFICLTHRPINVDMTWCTLSGLYFVWQPKNIQSKLGSDTAYLRLGVLNGMGRSRSFGTYFLDDGCLICKVETQIQIKPAWLQLKL